MGEKYVRATEPTLRPSEQATLTVTAGNIGAMEFIPPDTAHISVDLDIDAVDVTPRFSEILESDPPIWVWSKRESAIVVEIPVRVSADADPGEHRYTVTIWNDTYQKSTESRTEEFVITVENDREGHTGNR